MLRRVANKSGSLVMFRRDRTCKFRNSFGQELNIREHNIALEEMEKPP